MPGSYGLGAGTGSLSGMTGWGWGSYTGPASPFGGNLALIYCKTGGSEGPGDAFVASRLFACTSSPGVAGGIIGDIIPRAPDGVVCVNMCTHPTASGCVPCSDPGLICSREFGRGLGGALVGSGLGGTASLGGGGGGLVGSRSIGSVWLAEEIGRSGVMCPTPGADGGRALANTIPLI